MATDRDTLVHGLALGLAGMTWGTPELGTQIRTFLLHQLQTVGKGALVKASPLGQMFGLQAAGTDHALACLKAILDHDDAGREAIYREAWELANHGQDAGSGPAAGNGNAVIDAMVLEGLYQLKKQLGGPDHG